MYRFFLFKTLVASAAILTIVGCDSKRTVSTHQDPAKASKVVIAESNGPADVQLENIEATLAPDVVGATGYVFSIGWEYSKRETFHVWYDRDGAYQTQVILFSPPLDEKPKYDAKFDIQWGHIHDFTITQSSDEVLDLLFDQRVADARAKTRWIRRFRLDMRDHPP